MHRVTWILLSLLATLAHVSAQTAISHGEFEVASVKPVLVERSGGPVFSGGPGTKDPSRIRYTNVSLKLLVMRAYGARPHQITAPDWFDGERYDIVATLPEDTTPEQLAQMLQKLLVERFQMKCRWEERVLSVFGLVVGKKGSKLKAAEESHSDGDDQLRTVFDRRSMELRLTDGRFRLVACRTPIASLADTLSGQLGRPVVDLTGLTGFYDFTLVYESENGSEPGSDPSESRAPPKIDRNSIPAGLEAQLGLRLEARKAPVQFLIIESAEKIPTGN